jgi:predicted nucleic acid-binding Zn ribbon protein
MSPHRSAPRPLVVALEAVRDELAPETLLAEAQQAWREAVGSAIAGEAQPTAERGGVLTVSCSASVWAQELDLMSPAVIERLNGHLQSGQITRLRCVATPPP